MSIHLLYKFKLIKSDFDFINHFAFKSFYLIPTSDGSRD